MRASYFSCPGTLTTTKKPFMRKTLQTIALATLCLIFNAEAQTNIDPIYVGDKIPEIIWNKPFQVINHPEGKQTTSLKDYGNKLIILDFWASYCKPCIASLDYLYSIKDQFKDQLAVIPVQVYNRTELGILFMKKRGWTWPSITGDTSLNKIMLLNYLTGFGSAWIKDGKLLAVPSKKHLNAETITKVLAGEPVIFENRTGHRNNQLNQTN